MTVLRPREGTRLQHHQERVVHVLDPDMQMGDAADWSGYWVFVREAAALVPGGYAGGGGRRLEVR